MTYTPSYTISLLATLGRRALDREVHGRLDGSYWNLIGAPSRAQSDVAKTRAECARVVKAACCCVEGRRVHLDDLATTYERLQAELPEGVEVANDETARNTMFEAVLGALLKRRLI